MKMKACLKHWPLTVAALAVVAAGCGGSGESSNSLYNGLGSRSTPEAVKTATEKLVKGDGPKVAAGNNAFGFKLLQDLAKADDKRNVFISPASIALVSAMAMNGATGDTRGEIEKLLGLSGIKPSEVNATFKNLRTVLSNPDKNVELNVANSMWVERTYPLKQEFKSKNEEAFGAQITALDFTKEESVGIINDWVKSATRERIPSIVDQLSKESKLLIINAIYFKGAWKEPFDKNATKDDAFTKANGEKVTTPMMFQSGKYEYFANEKMQMVQLPYSSGRVVMRLVLPTPKSNIPAFLKDLNAKSWDEWNNKLTRKEGSVSIPRFKTEYDTSLVASLQALGMKKAFTDKAEFGGISEQDNLYVSEVRHRTFLDVNEEGTEAAAVTSMEFKATEAAPTQEEPFKFVANRPFLITILDTETNTVLFVGVINNPAKS